MLTLEETTNIIECILFLSPTPVTKRDLEEHLKISSGLIDEAISALAKRCENTGMELLKTAGGYEFATRKEYLEHLRSFFGKMDRTRLSRASLEAMAIIAYNQPVSRSDVERIRGVNSSGVLKSLLDRGLIRISGKGEGIGRPFMFSTTPDFLRYIGLDSLDDLPPLESFETKI